MNRTAPAVALATAALALILAGCSSAPEPAEPSSEPEPMQEQAVVDEPESTPEQWASVVAVEKDSWDEWYEDSWDGQCDFILANNDAGGLCRLAMLSASFMSQTSAINIGRMSDPDGLKQIADEPPAEIADLYASTLSAAETLEERAAAWDGASCSSEVKDECIALGREFEYAIDDLRDEFTAWSPYL